MGIYDILVKDINGQEIFLNMFQGKFFLIVNTATGCGFIPHYEGLQKFYDDYKDKNFEVLDFPCN
jgi:glutathione peroxidase